MAKGLRRIVVDGTPHHWRFDGVLVVIPANQSGPQLYVDWGWRDWLEPGEGEAGSEPRIVFPRFVAEAIRFAVTKDWPSTVGGPPLRLGFQDDCFGKTTKSQALFNEPSR